jgi:hypothetical protein
MMSEDVRRRNGSRYDISFCRSRLLTALSGSTALANVFRLGLESKHSVNPTVAASTHQRTEPAFQVLGEKEGHCQLNQIRDEEQRNRKSHNKQNKATKGLREAESPQ